MGANFNQYKLLLWKDWLLRKRRIWGTLAEILVPSVLFLLILALKAIKAPEDKAATTWPDEPLSRPGSPPFVTPELREALTAALDNDMVIAWAPATSAVAAALAARLNATLWPTVVAAGGSSTYLRSFPTPQAMAAAQQVDPKLIYAGLVMEPAGTRFRIQLRMMTQQPYNLPDTTNMFPLPKDDETGEQTTSGYFTSGFVDLQNILQVAYMERAAEQAGTSFNYTFLARKYPYPAWVDDPIILAISRTMPLFMALSWIYTAAMMVRAIVYEKEARLTEAMRMMGLKNWVYWSSFFTTNVIFMLAVVIVLTLIVMGGKVLRYSDGSLFFVFAFVFALATMSLCRLIAAFFSKTRLGAIAGGIIYFLFYLPYLFIEQNDQTTASARSSACLLSTTCFGLGMNIISFREQEQTGLTWSNINVSPFIDVDFTFSRCMGILLIDILLYNFIAWYIENVFPGEYGLPQRWYFLFTKSFWVGHSGKRTRVSSESGGGGGDVQMGAMGSGSVEAFEPPSNDLQDGIVLDRLRKVFQTNDGEKVAVDDLSLKMYKGQITALLGHNGAGKTTTMSMLVGLFPSTGGTAYVNGMDVAEDMPRIRKDLGICPQFNVLWETLTVAEHLEFYCGMKSLSKEETGPAVDGMLSDLKLAEKRNAPSKTLSGGMQRKLSVGIALIGGSSFVILDEPTAGMDPSARRATWDLLLKHKEGRTMLLSSHFMDECDLLGDRIAIMADGKLRCSGSSLFLKGRFGVGYHMTCVKQDENCDADGVTALVARHSPGAKLTTDVGAELSYVLPSKDSVVFEALFTELDGVRAKLGVSSYGISVTTLEEVFLKVTTEAEQERADKRERRDSHMLPPPDDDKNVKVTVAPSATSVGATGTAVGSSNDLVMKGGSGFTETIGNTSDLLTGRNLVVSQMRAMLWKRFHYSKRDKKALLFQLLLPAIFVVLALLVTLSRPVGENWPVLDLTPAEYSSVYQVPWQVNAADDPTDPAVEAVVKGMRDWCVNSKLKVVPTPATLDGYITKQGLQYQKQAFGGYVCGGEEMTYLYNLYGLHSPAIFLAVAGNAALQAKLPPATPALAMQFFPFPKTIQQQQDDLNDANVIISTVILVIFALAFIPAFYMIFPLVERVNNAKHLQFVSGLKPYIYWLSTYVWDMMCYLVPSILILIIFQIFDQTGWSGQNAGPLFLLLLLYGFSLIPFMYIFTFLFKSPPAAYVAMFALNFFIGLGTTLAVFILDQIDEQDVADALSWAFLVFPNYCIGNGLLWLNTNQYYDNIWQKAKELPMTPAQRARLHELYAYKDPYAFDNLGRNYLFMFLFSFIFFFLTVCIERRFFRTPKRVAAQRQSVGPEDDDVAAERLRIEALPTPAPGAPGDRDIIRLHNLSKQYAKPRKLAVNSLSLGIARGECFGLLGINGAGKTTTFKMLTGDETVSSGEAYMCGYSILDDMIEVRRRVGYCPQFDSLIELLTARELLTMYARIRGIPEDRVAETVHWCIHKLDLARYQNKLSGGYSGGNKRKLSTAVALVGNSPVLMLDEPTTGMDPKARRFLWNVVSSLMMAGRSIVLTSHSMEECEALCTRLVVMVDGQFKCLGSQQHLKTKFGHGYTVIIKVGGAEPAVEPVKEYMQATFSNIELQEEHSGQLQFQVSDPDMSLGRVFGAIEAQKDKLDIEDYVLSQTTLEQVFLNFARGAAE